MEFLLLVFFSLLTGSEVTFGAENGAALKPHLTIVDQTKDQAQLQCEVQGAFPKPELHWQDRAGNILHAEKPKESERGGRYDIILQTTVNKTDNYRCVVTQKEINHQIYAETYVYIHGLILKDRTDEYIPGAAPKPSVRILDQTLISALLQCEIRGAFPKPELEWQNGAGNILPAEEPKVTEKGGRYYIILQTTVTETDNYRCVATQKEISHQIYAGTYLYFSVETIVLIVLVVVVLALILLMLPVLWCRKSRTGSPSQSRQPPPQVPARSGRRRQQAEREEEVLEMNARVEETPSLEADLDLQLSAETPS